MPRTNKLAARISLWLSIRDICRFPAAEWDANQGPRKFVVRHSATADKHLALNPDIPVTSQTPPTFFLQAKDDHVDDVSDSLAYYIALKNVGFLWRCIFMRRAGMRSVCGARSFR